MNVPLFVIEIDGLPISDELLFRVLEWEYEDHEKMGKLTLVFDNRDFMIGYSKEIENGKMITFRHGYTDSMSTFKYFTIGKVSGWKIITVEAMEVIHIFNTEQKERTWEQVALSDVIENIADDNGMDYKTEDPKLNSGEVLKRDYIQNHVEDMAFLYTLGRWIGYEVWVEDGILHFLPRGYWQTPYMEFVYEGLKGTVLDFDPTVNTMNKRGKFACGGIDLETKQPFFFTEDGQTKRTFYLGKHFWDYEGVNAGKKKLQKASIVRKTVNNLKDAQDMLAGKWIKEMEHQITAKLHLVGEPQLKARRTIYVDNVGKFTGRYYVQNVVHSEKGGYLSIAELTRNAMFDDGGQYSMSNIHTVVNENRPNIFDWIKETKGSPRGSFYEALLP